LTADQKHAYTRLEMIVAGLKRPQLQQIAVVEMEGAIGPRLKAGEYVKLLRSLEDNQRVRAVVLDIDSPGGSVTGSDYLYLAVKSLASKKPVVAFIRGVGASGAYLISVPAAKIVAIPSSIIGSIGVISIRPLVYEALGRVGVSVNVTKSDKFKDMGSMFREPTEEELAKEQALIDELYGQFVDAVAEGRKMSQEAVKQIATGEIFTGVKAKSLGLVDELGDLERALEIASELGNVPRKPVWVHPRRGLRELLAQAIPGVIVNEIVSQVEDRLYTSAFQRYR
jgi:protease IV